MKLVLVRLAILLFVAGSSHDAEATSCERVDYCRHFHSEMVSCVPAIEHRERLENDATEAHLDEAPDAAIVTLRPLGARSVPCGETSWIRTPNARLTPADKSTVEYVSRTGCDGYPKTGGIVDVVVEDRPCPSLGSTPSIAEVLGTRHIQRFDELRPDRVPKLPAPELPDRGWTRLGPADAPVRLTAFVDAACGYPEYAHNRLRELVDLYPNRLAITVRMLLGDGVDRYHQTLLRGGLASINQGKYREFLAEFPPDPKFLALGEAEMFEAARSAGLDMARFREDYAQVGGGFSLMDATQAEGTAWSLVHSSFRTRTLPGALEGARMIHAAAKQGQLIEAYESLLPDCASIESRSLSELADALGLDPDRFATDFESEQTLQAIVADVALAREAENHTRSAYDLTSEEISRMRIGPSLYYGDRQIPRYWPAELLADLIPELAGE